MKNSKIWVVYNPQGRAPTFTHISYKSAKTEARRLASCNPDQRFYVMESVGMALKNDGSFYVHSSHGDIINGEQNSNYFTDIRSYRNDTRR
jgi:hypothetical protein